eukprot:CAMPEP_0170177964 /NCGR_PEP_ID=MMETSP0040_2-20121228/11494_1 /TAXON_ID=641309 /ORGANISM="Lotharella oceanica, Strain CCMP622" /LENGTH=73 /DNA_ID=CAMNT_0010420873 /DNA_START=218 /DNA_END=439 /DNA_ORIENTATION=+
MSTVPAPRETTGGTKPASAASAASSSSYASSPLSSLAAAVGSGSLAVYGLWSLSNTRCHRDDHEDYMGHIIHL